MIENNYKNKLIKLRVFLMMFYIEKVKFLINKNS